MVKVSVDALKPLTRRKSIQFPLGVEVFVDFEYLKLKKHCFHCMALSHEKDNFP